MAAPTWIFESLTTDPIATVTATVADTALTLLTFGFTQAQINAANRLRITTATAAVLFTYDGTTPVIATPVGHLLPTGVIPWELWGNAAIQNFMLIRQAGVSAVVTITLER